MSHCCTECFLDEYLTDIIKDEGEGLGKCDFCGAENVYVIDTIDLKSYFEPLINLYTPIVEFYPTDLLKECEGRFIWEILSDDWGIFDDWTKGEEIIRDMYRSDCWDYDVPLFLDNYVDSEDEWHGADKRVSDRLNKEWDEFCVEITYINRFFPESKINFELLSEVLSYSEEFINVNELLFRARISSSGILIQKNEMGAPPNEKAIEGRANPSWIPYLYLASTTNTAISEIRPQIHNYVSVGTFRVVEKIRVIDLREPYIKTPFCWGDNLAFVLDIHHFLRILSDKLSMPVDRRPSVIREYLPTQYLCEFIKRQGYDGVLYRSELGDGYNIVLFNDEKVLCTETKLFRVNSIRLDAEEFN